ncbi:MAG: flavin reductase family protein [Anaerolineae bacterium]|nr:flavin reductase family protein [Anaerolineae bacterium]
MDKVKINNGALGYPMPMLLVGSVSEGKPNFMPMAWVTRVNFNPVMIAVAMGPHYTATGIREHGEFSVNVPSVAMVAATDYCGLVSGKKQDKSGIFPVFYGDLAHAPMIESCPVTLACKLVQTVPLSTNTLFIGEVVDAYATPDVIVNGEPDIQKVQPFMLTMPDNGYWTLGAQAGQAWSIGKQFKPED